MDEKFRQLGMTKEEYEKEMYSFEEDLSNDPDLEELKRLAQKKKKRERGPQRWELDERDEPS